MTVSEQLKYVNINSNYVKINYNNLGIFVNRFERPCYKHWYSYTSLNLNEEEKIILVFIIESLNFCFFSKPKFNINYNGKIVKGSEALFYSIIRQVQKNRDFLNINNLIQISKSQFEKIFYSPNSKISLLDLRYKLFKDTVNIIHKKGSKFFFELFSKRSDKDLLNYIISEFKYFDDVSIYKGISVHFNKRATLLVNDLLWMSPTIHNNIKTVDNLTGCADYSVPRTLREYNVLEYNTILAEIVDNEIEIEHDSDMEIEIRANTLYVIELIKERLNNKNININSFEIDSIIWNMGSKLINKKPYHHTVTIFY